ncbi:NAD(P)H-quinone oxidoreductase subunit O, chloroplastic [Jatropha curcas]|uniref:NAD(P)H-quinone oxidoreductase subunit O, chloroplastic n=1 Tax=Jatropha curcas TaxID=180498 RepID=UPI0018956C30|nr:NAD(P)H-quinone oxidoreductase subunit O, chloroplastic [Jatropha curcas]
MAAFSATPCLSPFPQSLRRQHLHSVSIKAEQSVEPEKGKPTKTKTKESSSSSNAQPSTTKTAPRQIPKKPVYSMKKGQIVRVDKDKYLNSVNYLSVGSRQRQVTRQQLVQWSRWEIGDLYLGCQYSAPAWLPTDMLIKVLDLRMFETGEHALVAWVGIPTAPAWLPTDMLIKAEKLDYERL